MSNLSQLKTTLLAKAKAASACASEYRRAANAETEEQLLAVIKENLHWCSKNNCIDEEYFKGFTPEIYLASGIANTGSNNIGWGNVGDSNTGDRNTGYSNTGDWNTGDSNTGDRNTGYSNTGYSNTGDSNTGDRNTGYSNTGDRNTGDRNTGDRNTGDSNTGDRNTGYSNTGDRNTGDRNTGDWNTGDRNTGYSNTGDWNTGYSNTGDRNTGYSNTGYSNTGDWNTGDRNTGYSNTGDDNTGIFCTGLKTIPMFDKPSDWTREDFQRSKAFHLMRNYVDTKMWIPDSKMTDEEKENFPAYKTAGGYVKDIPFKEAFTNAWHNWDASSRKAFTSLPNFDAAIFEQITGVKV